MPTSTTVLERYLCSRAQFDLVLRSVRADQWDNPTPCPGWTVRDLVGHVTWGQDLIRSWATGAPFDNRVGGPGAARPGAYLGTDPVGQWGVARDAVTGALTTDGMAREVGTANFGLITVQAFADAMVTDLLAHTWDLGRAVGSEVHLDPDLVAHAQQWADAHAGGLRNDRGFGPAQRPPPGADAQTRLLAYLGRRPRDPPEGAGPYASSGSAPVTGAGSGPPGPAGTGT